MLNTKQHFTLSATVVGSEPYEINGLNIWDYEWRSTGERLMVQEGEDTSSYLVKEISFEGKVAKFVANEVSNGVWKIYHEY